MNVVMFAPIMYGTISFRSMYPFRYRGTNNPKLSETLVEARVTRAPIANDTAGCFRYICILGDRSSCASRWPNALSNNASPVYIDTAAMRNARIGANPPVTQATIGLKDRSMRSRRPVGVGI